MTVKKDEVHVDNEADLEPINDDAAPPITADPEPAPEPKAEAKDDGDDDEPQAPPPNPREARLKAIADKIKADRNKDAAPEFTGDFSDPSQTIGNLAKQRGEQDSLLPEFVRPDAAANEPAPVPAQQAAPKRIKLKVDHEEFERDIAQVAELADMTVEEVEAQPERAKRYAQRELAAQRRLDQAREILRGAQQRTQENPAPNQVRNDDPDYVPEPSADAPHQGNDLKQLVEDLQFGADPADIAQRLDGLITNKARDIASGEALRERMSERVSLTLKAFEKIKGENPTIFADPNNEAVMQRMLRDGYQEDLRAIGVPEDRIPRDVNQLADWWHLYGAKGQKVRSPEKLLTDVRDGFIKWRGGTPNPNPAPRTNGTVNVNVNRTDRRQAIPSQPTRASAPPQVPQAAPEKTSRAAVLDKMRRARGQASAA